MKGISTAKAYLTDSDIMERYGVGRHFINQFSRQMGVFAWRPRKYLPDVVEAFFRNRAIESATRPEREAQEKARAKEFMELTVNEVLAEMSAGKRRRG